MNLLPKILSPVAPLSTIFIIHFFYTLYLLHDHGCHHSHSATTLRWDLLISLLPYKIDYRFVKVPRKYFRTTFVPSAYFFFLHLGRNISIPKALKSNWPGFGLIRHASLSRRGSKQNLNNT
jgi:hypothetical protein